MAYSNTGLRLLVGALRDSGNLWIYESTDAAADVDAAGYISDGGDFGMKVGDLVQVIETDTGIISMHRVVSVNATTGAVDLGDGTTVGSATNSD